MREIIKPNGITEGLTPQQIIESCSRLIRTEYNIPLDRIIDDENAAIDQGRVEELARSMLNLNMQLEPSLLAAKMANSKVVYEIINGFHRKKAAALANMKGVDGIVMYGLSDEEINDLRIIAGTPKSVSFSRRCWWMQQSFNSSKWHKKGLTLTQMISIAISKENQHKVQVSHYAIVKDDILEIVEWVKDKSRKWKTSLSSLHTDFLLIENSYPEIVNQVRISKGGGREGAGILSYVKFKNLVELFPKNFDMQKVMVELIVRHNLDSKQIQIVGQKLLERNYQTLSLPIQQSILEDPLALLSEAERINKTSAGKLPKFARKIIEELSQKNSRLEEENTRLSQEIIKLRGENNNLLEENTHQVKQISGLKQQNSNLLEHAQDVAKILEEKVKLMVKIRNMYLVLSKIIMFWKYKEFKLSPFEKNVAESIFRDNLDLYEIASMQGNMKQIVNTFASIIVKYKEHIEELMIELKEQNKPTESDADAFKHNHNNSI